MSVEELRAAIERAIDEADENGSGVTFPVEDQEATLQAVKTAKGYEVAIKLEDGTDLALVVEGPSASVIVDEFLNTFITEYQGLDTVINNG